MLYTIGQNVNKLHWRHALLATPSVGAIFVIFGLLVRHPQVDFFSE